jgi:lon-related putative ATP-dependent protease
MERVKEAVRFGTEIQREGFNLFALGPAGTGKYSTISRFVKEKASKEAVPPDWCYVNDFKDNHKARTLSFPPGRGKAFRQDIASLIDDLRSTIPAIFESEDYITRKKIIEEEIRGKRDSAFAGLRQEAESRSLTLLRTPEGLAFAPVRDGNVMTPEEFSKLPAPLQKEYDQAIHDLQQRLQPILEKMPAWEKEGRQRLRDLNRTLARLGVAGLISDLRDEYKEFSEVVEHLNALQQDIIENSETFMKPAEEPANSIMEARQTRPSLEDSPLLRRYEVNLLVDHSESSGAPVVYEDNPTYPNLVGQVEHIASMRALVTDFTLIRPGALHRASGGYLILDAEKVLMNPYSWEGLKRALRSSQIRIESLGKALSMISTVSLEPDPIPLTVKVILIGERPLYYLLSQRDPEFSDLFKVAVDFGRKVDRDAENDLAYAQLIATMARNDQRKPFNKLAVGRIIEHGSRLAEDSAKLSFHHRTLADLLRESDYWAESNQKKVVEASDVELAIDAQIQRSDRVRHLIQEEIEKGTILIDTAGEQVGQVNGLSVLQLGNYAFGRPTRITARVRMGRGEVVDIEREVELGGPLHSKGVLILSSFLGARYSPDHPLSLSASLVFEQSYGGIDGDSASSAELYTLLSALSELPLKQFLAITGSVNQHGRVQAIGGVNEKIEGFFDLCSVHGLTGQQGVLIPSSNVQHLMLRLDVVEAAKEGRFHIYPVETIDDGIELLTGVKAGTRDKNGEFPPGSVNGLVEARLQGFAKKQAEFGKTKTENSGTSGSDKVDKS